MPANLLTDHFSFYFTRPRGSSKKMADTEIPKQKFIAALDDLNAKLKAEGKTLTFLCVGGGAMMLAYNARNGTHDLDGVMSPADPDTTELFHRLAAEVAREHKIDQDWINIQVKDIMHGQGFKRVNFEPVSPYTWSNLKLLFGKPGYLLSMKVQALRPGKQDFNDIVHLLRILRIKTLAGMQAEVEKYGGWEFVGNDEFTRLKLTIAWAFPGETEYDNIRQWALKQRKPK